MDCSPPGSSVYDISQARISEWVAVYFFRGSSRPKDQTCITCVGRQSLPSSHQRSPALFLWVSIKSAPFISSLLLFSHMSDFATTWTATRQASLSFIISWSLLKFMSIESVMPSNHLILCCPLFLLHSVFPSIRIFSSESALCIR